MSPKTRRVLKAAGTIASLLLAANTAWGMAGQVRAVDVLLLFATGMSAGATLTSLIVQLRGQRGA